MISPGPRLPDERRHSYQAGYSKGLEIAFQVPIQGPFILSLDCAELSLHCTPLNFRSGILEGKEDRKPTCFNLYAFTGLMVRAFPGFKP